MSLHNRRVTGRILIWLGVLAWAPWLYFVATRQETSILPFLGVHLTGVLGGVWLRSGADRLEGLDRSKAVHGQRRRIVGRVMIYLGILAWAPYFYLTRALGQEVEIASFLTAHLTGVLGGIALWLSVKLDRFFHK